VNAAEGKQDLQITREFELPVDLLFRAYVEPELLEQWMNTKVLKLEHQSHGSYLFETTAPQGYTFRMNGAIHAVVPNERIIRTFEMEGSPFGVQLEFLEFIALTEDTSRLDIHTVYRSVAERDQVLKLPFKYGINMAHNTLQALMEKLK
jgi:uncharacterized protein YndB with AHSA1/START domain